MKNNKSIKRIIPLFLVISVVTILIVLSKKSIWIGDYKCEINLINRSVIVEGYRGADEDYDMPLKVGIFDVEFFRPEVFDYNENIKSVFVPKEIKKYVDFCECNNLEKVVFEDGRKTIELTDIACNPKLSTVIFPKDVERIYIDMTGQPGNSGSPVVDIKNGTVIGIYTGASISRTHDIVNQIQCATPVKPLWGLIKKNKRRN